MRAWWAVALATALGAGASTAPLAGQSMETDAGSKDAAKSRHPVMAADQATHTGTGRRIWQPFSVQNGQALAVSARLSKYTTQGDLKGETVALGKSLLFPFVLAPRIVPSLTMVTLLGCEPSPRSVTIMPSPSEIVTPW